MPFMLSYEEAASLPTIPVIDSNLVVTHPTTIEGVSSPDLV